MSEMACYRHLTSTANKFHLEYYPEPPKMAVSRTWPGPRASAAKEPYEIRMGAGGIDSVHDHPARPRGVPRRHAAGVRVNIADHGSRQRASFGCVVVQAIFPFMARGHLTRCGLVAGLVGP